MTLQSKTLETQITKRVRLNYLLHLPPDYDPAKQFPLIFFLHGRDERGDDVEILKRHGIPKLIGEQPDFPFIVVSPQCPADSDWSVEMDGLIALLDHITTNLAVDESRVYLTGLSMGGRGAYQLAALQPHRFAALAPICGPRPDVMRRAERMRALIHLPIWIFHGALDSIVSVDESIKMADELKSLGGDVRLTIYPDAKHDAWTRTYGNPELYEWMMAHKNFGRR
ncbi:MAG: prolyl oligopeptidase family serine peptidase [Chloroflexi bacterium]|nr:prolyl oligopeptidase family serine peptidase [Chloroflexota bacterium]